MIRWQEISTFRRFLIWWSAGTLLLLVGTFASNYWAVSRSIEKNSQIHGTLLNLRTAEEQLQSVDFRVGQKQTFVLSKLAELSWLPPTEAFSGSAQGIRSLQSLVDSLFEQLESLPRLDSSLANRQAEVHSLATAEKSEDVLYVLEVLDDWLKDFDGNSMQDPRSISYLETALEEGETASLRQPALASAYASFLTLLQQRMQVQVDAQSFQMRALRMMQNASQSLEQHAISMDGNVHQSAMLHTALILLLLLNLAWVLMQALGGRLAPAVNAISTSSMVAAEIASISERAEALLIAVDRAWSDARQETVLMQKVMRDSQDMESQAVELESIRRTQILPGFRNLSQTLAELAGSVDAGAVSPEILRPLVDSARKIEASLEERESLFQQELESLGHTGITLQNELRTISKTLRKLRTSTDSIRQKTESLEESTELIQSTLS